jgi:2-oxoglutarate ferredoxin oxidoreductase subunit alpha
MQESLSEICFARVPLLVINMARGQGDYFQATRGGGHGDYRHIVLAPSDIPEAVYLTQLAFHLSDYWRNPVFLFGDYYLAHVSEAVDTSAVNFDELPAKDWALDGSTGGSGHAKIVSPLRDSKRRGENQLQYGQHLMKAGSHIAQMAAEVQPLVELGFTDDAELIVVAYGTPGRYVRYVVNRLREEGLPVGFVRPITLWPFPTAALVSAIGAQTRAVAVYELNAGQMIEDVRLAVLGKVPVSGIGGASFDASAFGIAPALEVDIVSDRIRECLQSIKEPV